MHVNSIQFLTDVIWVAVQKDVTQLSCNLYLAFVYLPLYKVNGNDILQKLEKTY